ncbi:hypothetical protein ACFYZJ_14190 [Streptomyces sp. NPDC001848]|uniref:hypothetical protein n=1 Tax=Streptomyces sp. NPDC001848 TaxID=3364618 RepID=UPI0036C395D1
MLALGGVPQSEFQDGVQQVRLRLLERQAGGEQAPRELGAWVAAVASDIAVDWHRARSRQERIGARLAALGPLGAEMSGGQEASLLTLAVADGLESVPVPQRQVIVPSPSGPGAVRRPRGNARRWALAACAALVASLLGAGLMWSAAQPSGDAGGASAAKLSREGIVACARTIVRGTVTGVRPDGGRTRLVLRAERHLKPEHGPRDAEFTVPTDEARRYRPGTELLVSVSRFPEEPVMIFVGDDMAPNWDWMASALPTSRSTPRDTPG